MGNGITVLRNQYSAFGLYPDASLGFESNLVETSAAGRKGTTLTAGGTAHTVGSYSELIASLNNDVTALSIYLMGVGAVSAIRNMLINFATGAASSEVNFLSLDASGCGADPANETQMGFYYHVPGISIPSGTRLSANCQASTASDTVVVAIWAHSNISTSLSGTWTSYGLNLTTSMGAIVAPGADSYGSWTEIATTSSAHSLWFACIGQADNQANTSSNLMQLAYGPNTSSLTTLPGELMMGSASTEQYGLTMPNFFVWDVATSTKVWARLASSAAGLNYGVSLYGLAV